MKLSNKVLIGFFGLLMVYMIAAFTEIRFKGDLNRLTEGQGSMERAMIPDVSYLDVKDLGRRTITIQASDSNYIELRSISGTALSKLSFEMVNDTLLIHDFTPDKGDHSHIIIHLKNGLLKQLYVEGTTVIMKDFKQQKLGLNYVGGRMRLTGTNRIDSLSIHATSDADVQTSSIAHDVVTIDSDSSMVHLYTNIGRVEGVIRNASSLSINDTDDVQLTKDETSNWRMFN